MRGSRRTFQLNPILAAISVALASPAAQAAAVSWTNPASGNWSPATPAAADDVTINRPETLTVTYNSGTLSITSLVIGSANNTLAVSVGTLNAGALSNAGTVTISRANTVSGFSGGNSGAMNFNGGVANLSGILTINGAVRIGGGTLAGGTVRQSAGNALAFSNGASNTLNAVTLRGRA